MGGLALLFAIVGTVETIIDGICTCYFLPEEVRKGELCHGEYHAIIVLSCRCVHANLVPCETHILNYFIVHLLSLQQFNFLVRHRRLGGLRSLVCMCCCIASSGFRLASFSFHNLQCVSEIRLKSVSTLTGVSLISDVTYSHYTLAERSTGWTALNICDGIFLVLGVLLWIAVVVILHFPPNGSK